MSLKNWDNKTWLSSSSYIKSFNNFLLKQVKLNKNSQILDIGCGRGKILGSLSSKLSLKRKSIGIDIENHKDRDKRIIFKKIDALKFLKKNKKRFDLILAPAMGGIIIGYEIGKILKKETIFCERVNGRFTLRRGFRIKKKAKVLIIEDVITTGKSSLECSQLVKDNGGVVVGYACIINRSNGKTLIKDKIISQIELNIPTYTEKNLPKELLAIKAVKPGSRNL